MRSSSRILLVAGIPASGKSTYARWLVKNKGFALYDVDFASDKNPLNRWIAQTEESGSQGVIDWGFPPSNLDTVNWLISNGAAAWWFGGDPAAARASFALRSAKGEHPASLAAFEHQMAQIEANWHRIEPVFRGRIIRSVLPGPVYLEPKVIFDQMKAH